MGVGASNLSRSSLDVYQESITKIGQQLRAKASNKSQQNVNITQTITVQNESVGVCESSERSQRMCESQCAYDSRLPTYQCQFSTPSRRMGDDIATNPSNCDIMYGTMDEALTYDGICEGQSDKNEFEVEDLCIRRARRLACPTNPYLEISAQNGYTENSCNDNCNQTTYIGIIDLGNGKKRYDIRDGNSAIFSQPSGTKGVDWLELKGTDTYDCNVGDPGGIGRLNGISLQSCKNDCAINWACTNTGDSIGGIIECSGGSGGLCLTNTTEVSLSSEQLAETNIKSEMVTGITNDFQSEVLKTISQTNSGLNFAQFNTSEEATTITQIIKNKVTNSINADAGNTNEQDSGLVQSIVLVNKGTIKGSATCGAKIPPNYGPCLDPELSIQEKKDCETRISEEYYANIPEGGEVCATNNGSGCGCSITNETVQEMRNIQEATSVIDSIFNSTILNKIISDYTLDVSQLNKGLSFDFWVYIIIAAILGGAWVAGKVVGSSSQILSVLLSPGVLAIIGIITSIIYAVVSNKDDEDDEDDDPPPPDIDTDIDVDVDVDVNSPNCQADAPSCELDVDTEVDTEIDTFRNVYKGY